MSKPKHSLQSSESKIDILKSNYNRRKSNGGYLILCSSQSIECIKCDLAENLYLMPLGTVCQPNYVEFQMNYMVGKEIATSILFYVLYRL